MKDPVVSRHAPAATLRLVLLEHSASSRLALTTRWRKGPHQYAKYNGSVIHISRRGVKADSSIARPLDRRRREDRSEPISQLERF
jgi:hypothetical protein